MRGMMQCRTMTELNGLIADKSLQGNTIISSAGEEELHFQNSQHDDTAKRLSKGGRTSLQQIMRV